MNPADQTHATVIVGRDDIKAISGLINDKQAANCTPIWRYIKLVN
jgi:hypothetical protein